MASDEIKTNWCHLHSQNADKCVNKLCRTRANDLNYAFFDREQDIFTPMGESVAAMHELYESYVAGGFTPRQALWLTAAMVNPSFGQPPDGVSPGDVNPSS